MKLAFVFPGQGSQSIGMLRELAQAHQEVEETFAQASSALGFDLWELTQRGPEERLNQTEVTQPAMLAAGVAVWRTWRAQGGPDAICMAGHSLGEYTALTCAGAIEFTDAIKLVADRARFMQQAVPPGQGSMAVIVGLDRDAVRALCMRAAQGDVLEAVNFNTPDQIVIAGTAAAVARAIEQAKAAGAKRALPIPVSVPAHSSLLCPAAERFAQRLRETTLRAPKVRVLHNVHGRSEPSAAALQAILVRQLASPVCWVDTITRMAQEGVTLMLELGPGKVLSGLGKRIVRELECISVNDPVSLAEALRRAETGNIAHAAGDG